MILLSFISILLAVLGTQAGPTGVSDDLPIKCFTQDGREGLCLEINECPSIQNSSENATADHSSGCDHPGVCCGIQESTDKQGVAAGSGLDDICGRSSVVQSNRIVGGQPADLGAWPWMAALGYVMPILKSDKVLWLCGGSLISKRYVLTAAHCVRQPPSDPTVLRVIRLGEHDFANDTDGATPMDFGIESVTVHRNYKSQTNDIALIKLDREVTFTDKIRPICLPKSSALRMSSFENKYPFVAGWGATKYSEDPQDQGISTTLLQVQIPVVNNDYCRKVYGFKITDSNICAGDPKGGKDSCSGDSGGPLMLPHKDGRYYQIGVVSYGIRCAEPGIPGVYTRLTSFVDWLVANAHDLD